MLTTPAYREDVRAVLADMLEGRADVRAGLMFGFPAFYAGRRLVACLYEAGVGIRVPPAEAAHLRGAPTAPFEPYGRTMRAWSFLQPAAAEDLRAETAVLERAIAHARHGTVAA